MPTAILRIDGDTSGLARAFGDIRAQAKATAAQLKSAFDGAFDGAAKGAARAAGASRTAGRAMRDDAAKTAAASERAAQHSLQAFIRAEEQKRRAAALSAKGREAAEREATRVAADEARKRGLNAEQEARLRQNALERLTRVVEREERKQTQIAKREADARDRAGRNVGIGLRRGLNVGGDAALNVARRAHSEIQDARRARAEGERTLGNAVRNAGGSTREVTEASAQVRAFSARTGIPFADVASALELGQGRGSALEAPAGGTRADALRGALSTIREANAEGIDPGQLLAARGRLGAAGLSGDALTGALRYTMRAAQRGSVEVDQIIQQGLPGAAALMTSRAAALGPNASESERQAARLRAFQESVATQEIAASAGRRAGNTANVVAGLDQFIRTPRRQEMILRNIQVAESQINTDTPEGRERAARLHSLYTGEGAMFEADPTRRGNAMRLRSDVDAMTFAARLTTAAGDAQGGAMSLLAGSGHGNAQSLLANQRSLLAFMGSEGARIQAMMAGGGVTDAQIAEHQSAVEGDTLSTLTRNEEERNNALTDNTSAIVTLSNALNNFTTRNPIASSAIQSGGGLLGGVLGGAIFPRIGKAIVGTTLGGQLAGLGGAAGTAAATTTLGGLAAATGAGAATLGAAGQSLRTAITGRDLSGNNVGAFRQATAAAGTILTPLAAGEVGRQIGDYIVNAFRSAPLTATVSPVDATHAAAQATVP